MWDGGHPWVIIWQPFGLMYKPGGVTKKPMHLHKWCSKMAKAALGLFESEFKPHKKDVGSRK